FDDGALGNEPSLNAARVEGALLWFLYVSVFKESNTCTGAAKDCDSSWAYYGGGEQADGGLGYAGYVRELEPDTHQAVFNGLLAVRCWRDLDDGETAEDLALRDRALAQLDSALDRSLAVILIDRLETFAAAEGQAKADAWAFLEILGPVIDRAARNVDAGAADRLVATWSGRPEDADPAGAIADLEALFPCP
ncbi:MAG: hypothetical protein KC583_24235, partial [Myxococcales bacterium]|nr:hypothetical protein [Myxococcales bacterium]